jgi:hypothetical protein
MADRDPCFIVNHLLLHSHPSNNHNCMLELINIHQTLDHLVESLLTYRVYLILKVGVLPSEPLLHYESIYDSRTRCLQPFLNIFSTMFVELDLKPSSPLYNYDLFHELVDVNRKLLLTHTYL